MNVEQIRELVSLLRECNVKELTLRSNGRSVTLRKETAAPTAAATAEIPAFTVSLPGSPSVNVPPSTPVQSPLVVVTAPVVGIVRQVKDRSGALRWHVGDVVERDEVVCIVESMRIPNEVHAPSAGRIASILAEEDEPVEYGRALMEIDTTPTLVAVSSQAEGEV
jgi:acetyl-CoA carboxylase biotin carboxyl carrier protein